MRVDILAIGSRGDVQPYLALGLGLRTAGHRVRIVTLEGFEDLIRGRGLDHLAIGHAPQEIANTSAGRDWVKHRTSAAGFLRGFVQVANSLIEDGIARYWHQCGDPDAVIVSPMGYLVGAHVAERLGVPLILAQLAPPVVPTRYDWDGRTNLRTAVQCRLKAGVHAAFQFLVWSKLRRSTNDARRRFLKLQPLPLTESFKAAKRRNLILGGYSPAVAARPADWGEWMHVTGYWFLDEPVWNAPQELVDFLDSGPRPIFIGFGSTPFPRPDAATDLVVRAVGAAGCRAIVLAGGSGLATGQLTPEILSLDSVPHAWLFSHVRAAVHHGGAGVTGAALRAGLPSVVVPVFADQPFWGSRVFRLGAGPRPIPAQHLTTDNLAEAIRATANPQIRERAAALGKQIRSEDGVTRAVEIIETGMATHLGKRALHATSHEYAH
jgi:UDP:flavonoid glycosyltransferase YjiC (YdhE family)